MPRLIGWTIAAVVVLAGDLFARPVVAFTGLAALVALLRTTPADAYKLRRWHSDLLIFCGSILVTPLRWSAIVMIGLTAATLLWLRFTRRSSWWATLIAWNPTAVSLGWGTTVAATGAALIPVVALTGLAFSLGFSRWLLLICVGFDAVWFRAGRIQKSRSRAR